MKESERWELRAKAHEATALSYEYQIKADGDPINIGHLEKMVSCYRMLADDAMKCAELERNLEDGNG